MSLTSCMATHIHSTHTHTLTHSHTHTLTLHTHTLHTHFTPHTLTLHTLTLHTSHTGIGGNDLVQDVGIAQARYVPTLTLTIRPGTYQPSP